jgi:pyruvate formate lyase activating enzyme
MDIKGLQKLSLLDFKGYLAATIFTGGCNFSCPFCHNKSLVLHPNDLSNISEDEIFSFLKSRYGKLEAVCITGGEPTLQHDLTSFIHNVKNLGYKVKLDTNGSNPNILKELLDYNLLDYVAMDIKNTRKKYPVTTNSALSLDAIDYSISLIMSSPVSYEFRTTVVKELHTKEDIKTISQRIAGASTYYLQPYIQSPGVINPVYTSYTKKELQILLHIATPYVKKCAIIGI